MSPLVKVSTAEALKLVRGNMAFAGHVGEWLDDEINTPNSQTYVAQLAPIKRTCKLPGIRWKTRLRFELSGPRKATLRFQGMDREVAKPTQIGVQKWRLDELGEAAIALVLDSATDKNGACRLSVKAGAQGIIIDEGKLGQGESGKQVFIWYFRVIDPADMVGWYDPLQLARTAVEVFFSTLFGRHSDYRLIEALTADSRPFYDFTQHWKRGAELCDEEDAQGEARKDIWIDYVGDVGDGWNSTYTIAHCLSQPELAVGTAGTETCLTKRGDILIFGGDQVYPIANRLNYRQRLMGPYQTALDETEPPHPHAFAIPGNHDWYDSLVSFTRLFCQRRFFAGWQTDQTRSYFALRLPGKWWILGTDVQLDSDIDVPQVNYFKRVAQDIQPGDHVIICTAEPHWIYAALYAKDDSNYNENNLAFFEKRIIGGKAQIVAFIAGDQHHYRRFESAEGTQKITAGGGGAFLHPTHGEELKTLPGGFVHKKSFPSKWRSHALALLNLFFLILNFRFGLLTALFYLLTSWAVRANVSPARSFGEAVCIVSDRLVVSPTGVFLVVALFLGFVLFTDTHSKWYRWIAGPIHGAAHLLAVFFIGWAATWYSVTPTSPFESVRQLLIAGLIIFVGGWIVGPTIMGLYLLISLSVFGRHSNEAFSSLAIRGWKNFLRIRIEANGNLTLFPIGLRKVPRRWKRRADGVSGPGYEPKKKNGIVPALIEAPILFTPIAGTHGEVSVSISDQAYLKK